MTETIVILKPRPPAHIPSGRGFSGCRVDKAPLTWIGPSIERSQGEVLTERRKRRAIPVGSQLAPAIQTRISCCKKPLPRHDGREDFGMIRPD